MLIDNGGDTRARIKKELGNIKSKETSQEYHTRVDMKEISLCFA